MVPSLFGDPAGPENFVADQTTEGQSTQCYIPEGINITTDVYGRGKPILSVTLSKRGLESLEMRLVPSSEGTTQCFQNIPKEVYSPCFLILSSVNQPETHQYLFLAPQGVLEQHGRSIQEFENSKPQEKDAFQEETHHYSQPVDLVERPIDNELETQTLNNILSSIENVPSMFTKTEETKLQKPSQEGQQDASVSLRLIQDELAEAQSPNFASAPQNLQMDHQIYSDPLPEIANELPEKINSNSAIDEPEEPQEDLQDDEKTPLQTPLKLNNQLQQLATDLRNKTRSQQKKDARTQIRHEYIYNHNSVLLGERIEDLDFDENYFRRKGRLNKKDKQNDHNDTSAKKKRQTGAGECCICYSKSGFTK